MVSLTLSRKGGIVIFYDSMLAEGQKIESEINMIRSKIAQLPEGKFVCARNGRNYKWYRSDGHTLTYIPKKERKLAEQLAYKEYLLLRLAECQKEKKAIERYLSCSEQSIGKAEQLLINNSEYQKLVSPYFQPMSKELAEWCASSFEQNSRYPEQLIHKTISGNMVRSKSEVLIDMMLHMHQIPFRYECALHLDTSTVYPDFTIRHPKTGETFYWEHFGLMDDSHYSRSACSKLQLYVSAGIIPGIHLITTFETQEHPLMSETIENIIQQYFLK